MAMMLNFVNSFRSFVVTIASSMLWFLPRVWVTPMPKKMIPNRAALQDFGSFVDLLLRDAGHDIGESLSLNATRSASKSS